MLLGVFTVHGGELKGVHDLFVDGLGADGEGAAQLGHGLLGDAGLGELVHLKLHHFLFLFDHHGNNLVLEPAGLLGGLGLLLGGGGELVQLFPGDAPDIADVLCGGAHVVVVEGVPQAVVDHGVHHGGIEHAGAAPGGGHRVGGHGHVLSAAAHHHVGIASQDGTGGLDDTLHAGAAHHAHGVGGDGVGQAGLHAYLTGHVLALGGGEDAAEHQLVHVLRLQAGTLQRGFNHHCAQLGGGGVGQTALKSAHRRAAAAGYVEFFHVVKPPKNNFHRSYASTKIIYPWS